LKNERLDEIFFTTTSSSPIFLNEGTDCPKILQGLNPKIYLIGTVSDDLDPRTQGFCSAGCFERREEEGFCAATLQQRDLTTAAATEQLSRCWILRVAPPRCSINLCARFS
jgi:hypothetical protein